MAEAIVLDVVLFLPLLAILLPAAFFGLLAFGLMLLASICLGGPVSTGIREYALIFYGGRYQALGEILYPPPPPPRAV